MRSPQVYFVFFLSGPVMCKFSFESPYLRITLVRDKQSYHKLPLFSSCLWIAHKCSGVHSLKNVRYTSYTTNYKRYKTLTRARKATSLSVEETRTLSNLTNFFDKNKLKKALVEKLPGRKLPKWTLCTSKWKEEKRRWAWSASKVHSSGYSRRQFSIETSNNPQQETITCP